MRPRHGITTVLLGVALAACSGSDGGGPSGDTEPIFADTLVAEAGDPAPDFIPNAAPDVGETDFAVEGTASPGVERSVNLVLVVPATDATVGEVNRTLAALGGRVAGGVRGRAGAAGGLMLLRFGTTTHAELDAVLAQLRAATWVALAAKDQLLYAAALPRRTSTTGWTWEVSPQGGNWGLEMIRAPQLWNFNDALRARGTKVGVLVFDTEFDLPHTDLAATLVTSRTPPRGAHGNHVAGIVGATFENGLGVEGVMPFARLSLGTEAVRVTDGATSIADLVLTLNRLLDADPAIRVVNTSFGYDWGDRGVDIRNAPEEQAVAETHGAAFAEFLRARAGRQKPLPVITASAGNDSRRGADQPARFGSPMCNASFLSGGAAVICVEATGQVGTEGVDVERYFASNVGGQVSAPGSAVTSLGTGNGVEEEFGTSMAAPHVAGLVAYLFAIAPSLPSPEPGTNVVRDLLVNTARPVAGMAPMVDAYAAALAIDSVTRGTAARLALLDIDDGSPDGNQRADSAGTATSGADLDGNGGPGDGVVDMSDFRRWRDGLLQAAGALTLTLDGPEDSPKRDVNGDGTLDGPDVEGVHPRGDFNGDGILSRTAERLVGGIAPGQLRTDLAVLSLAFQDPAAPPVPLASLVASGDIHVRSVACQPGAGEQVRVSVRRTAGGTFAHSHVFAAGETEFVFTVPMDETALQPTPYEVVTILETTGGQAQDTKTTTAGVSLGGDVWLTPRCAVSSIAITTSTLPAGTVGQAYSTTLQASGGTAPLTWSASGLPGGLGVNAQTGLISGTPTGAGSFTVQASVRSADGRTAQRALPLTVAASTGGACEDVRIDSDASLDAALGKSCLRNVLISGFNNRITRPVSLPNLTRITEAFRVDGQLPGLTLPALTQLSAPTFGTLVEVQGVATLDLGSATSSSDFTLRNSNSMTGFTLGSGGITVSGDLAITGNAALTSLQLRVGRVNGSLTIANNAELADLNGVPCGMTITGNLTISSNAKLPIATAQAKANCLNVSGSKTVN